MMVVLLVAGLGLLLAGLLAIGYGIPINEFGFGNTLIVAGTVSACTGMIMLGLWMVVRELKNIAQQFSPGVPMESHAGTALQSASAWLRKIPAVRNRQRRHPRHRRRHGTRRPLRAIACRPCRSLSRARHRSSRAAICCFPRHRGKSASALRRGRPTHPRLIFFPRHPPRHQLPNQARCRRRRSKTAGQGRNARGPSMCRRSGAAAGRHRRLPKQTKPRQIATRRLREMRISRR